MKAGSVLMDGCFFAGVHGEACLQYGMTGSYVAWRIAVNQLPVFLRGESDGHP
jgi:hypothetical protein